MSSSFTRRAVFVLAAAVLFVAAGCGDSGSSSSSTTTTTTAATSTTSAANAQTVRFDKTIQRELYDVGCYTGNVDGIMGPETDAAIVAFQRAEGLAVDGELGPETDTALQKAAADGTKVCGTTSTTGTSTTTTAGGGTAPCTATAITAALESGEQVTNYVCSDGWAAGSWTNGQADGAFILQSADGAWTTPAQDPCGSASAGLPPIILQDGCAS